MLCTDLCMLTEQVARHLIGDEVCRASHVYFCTYYLFPDFIGIDQNSRLQKGATFVGLSSHGANRPTA